MNKFREKDRGMLAEICKKYPVIMQKSYTSDCITAKASAWQDISKEFNACNPGDPPKAVAQIQNLWKRMKVKAKEDMDTRRKEVKKTGGGPTMPPPSTSSQLVGDMLGKEYDPLPMLFDDDHEDTEDVIFDGVVDVIESMPASTPSPGAERTPSTSRKRKRPDGVEGVILDMAKELHSKKMGVVENKKKGNDELLELKKKTLQNKYDTSEIKKKCTTNKLEVMEIKKKCETNKLDLIEIKKETALYRNSIVRMNLAKCQQKPSQ